MHCLHFLRTARRLAGAVLLFACGCGGKATLDGAAVSTGGSGSGGASSANAGADSGNGGSRIDATCQSDDDCVAAIDLRDHCAGCGPLPVAASREDLAQNRCVIRWADAPNPKPPGCPSPDDVSDCSAECPGVRECPLPRCDAGHCVLSAPEVCEELCARRDAEYKDALAKAQACDRSLGPYSQCDGSEWVRGVCSPVYLNEKHPELVQAVRALLRQQEDGLCVYSTPSCILQDDRPGPSYCGASGMCEAGSPTLPR